MYDGFLARLALDIDDRGIQAMDDDVAVVVAAAAATGAPEALIAVLVDPRAPEVARGRAYGRLAMHLSRHFGEVRAPQHRAPVGTVGALA